MPARTAILGWGSLLWEGGPDFDRQRDEWRYDGPSLKLEFSRVSSSRMGALTLVVDELHGSATAVAWCLTKREDPADAAADLRSREGCNIKHVARLNLPASPEDLGKHPGSAEIEVWAKTVKVDVVVWTELPSNFEAEVNKPFSVEAAIGYLKTLQPPAKVRAAEYIWRAPEFVRTRLREAVEKEPWFPERQQSADAARPQPVPHSSDSQLTSTKPQGATMIRAERAAQIWQVLASAANHRQVLTYEIVADLIGIGPEGKGAGTLSQPLGNIMEYCRANGLPPLTVLVVNKGTGQPGSGLRTIEELHMDRERVFAYKWHRLRPPQVDELAQHVPARPAEGDGQLP